MPYVPAVSFLDSVRGALLGTNVVLAVLVALMLFLVGRRAAGPRAGIWAAACWLVCPLVALGGPTGHNDVIVTLCVLGLVVVLDHPARRGVAVAAAAATKFLPLLLLATALRRRDEPRRAALHVLAAFVLASAVIWAIGFRDAHGFHEFVDAFRYQRSRDDIAGFWGLSGLGAGRNVLLAVGVAVAAAGLWIARRASTYGLVATFAAILSIVVVSLPQFWFTYATWVVPLLVLLPLFVERSPAQLPEPATDEPESVPVARAARA
jgi:uncharacterized membrane protein